MPEPGHAKPSAAPKSAVVHIAPTYGQVIVPANGVDVGTTLNACSSTDDPVDRGDHWR